jgi:hypothetical protein
VVSFSAGRVDDAEQTDDVDELRETVAIDGVRFGLEVNVTLCEYAGEVQRQIKKGSAHLYNIATCMYLRKDEFGPYQKCAAATVMLQ